MFYEKSSFKKIIASFILFFGIIFTPHFCHAQWMNPDLGGFSYGSMLDEMMKEINGEIMGVLKQSALQAMTETVNNAISQGNGSGPMFVTNWEDFLYNNPLQETNLYMNDFFSSITSGRGSLSGYIGSGGTNYQMDLVAGAKGITINASLPTCDITDASDAFTSGNWNKLSSIFGNDACNKFGFNNISASAYLSELSKKQEAASAKGQAYQGFLPQTSGGIVTTPGSTIAAIQAQTQDIGNKILASANNPAEVITSLVSRLATKTIQQGIGQAQTYAQQKIKSNLNSASQKNSTSNPGQTFKPSY